MNQQMSFYSKTSEINYNFSMISGLMQFDKFDLNQIKNIVVKKFIKLFMKD